MIPASALCRVFKSFTDSSKKTPPSGGPMFTAIQDIKKSNLFGWVASLVIALAVTFCFYDPAEPKANLYWFGTVMGICMFAFDVLPTFATAILLLMFYIITGIARPGMAFVGWTKPIPWMCMCGMLIGILMDKCNISSRIALLTISKIGRTPIRLYIAFYISGMILGAIIPDTLTVIIIFMAIASTICKKLDLPPISRASSTIILGAFIGAQVACATYLPDNVGIIAMEMVKEIGITTSWLQYFWENLPFSVLHALVAFTILHFFGSKQLAAHINNARVYAEEELRALGPVSSSEYRTLGLAVMALIAFMTEPFHGIPGYYAFCTVVLLGFTPCVGLLDKGDLKKIDFPILFFISACMAIGIIGMELDIPKKVVAGIMPVMQAVESSSIIAMASYWFGFVVNMLLTPVAAATTLSIPIAEIATNLGEPVKPVLYSFLYGLNQFVLPYELGQALVMFATGYVHIKHIVIVMGLRTVFVTIVIGIMATFVWPLMGI